MCCGYPFELHRQVDAVQMSSHNICFYKEVDKKYTGCYLKTAEFLECVLIGAYGVIRSNTEFKLVSHLLYLLLKHLHVFVVSAHDFKSLVPALNSVRGRIQHMTIGRFIV